VAPYHDLGEAVHSSRIRGLLTNQGAADEVTALLGRPYRLWGEVTRGARRGHNLGYPTANLAVPESRLVPAYGIYACWAWLGEDDPAGHPAAVSIGVRPTFDNGERSIEAYLLDFRDDLYGQRLGLSFISRLRPELRFPSPEALIAQMAQDVNQTRAILGNPPDDAGQAADADQPWEELRHTADWAVRVSGASPRQLLARAAAAMFALEESADSAPITLARSLEVEAADLPELLVAWLNRLLYYQEVHGEMYTRFEIHDLSDRGLLATVYGHSGRPEHTAVKAATFWDLAVTQKASEWEATITFDV
ncbi:MAG TPA: archease, partial [Anaerolineae bacterium]